MIIGMSADLDCGDLIAHSPAFTTLFQPLLISILYH